MAERPHPSALSRIHALRRRLRALAGDEDLSPGTDAPAGDLHAELDAVEAELDRVEREYAELRERQRRSEEQLGDLFEVITAFASLDYSRRARTYEGYDEITNALAIGLNMMGEELQQAMDLLIDARDKALAANHAKSAFLANISHELRTPLNAVIGYAEILREDMQAAGLDELGTDLDKIMISARHLLQLIQDVLDLSTIEAGKLSVVLEPVDIPRLVEELRVTLEPSVVRAGNHLRVRCELARPIALLDPLRLQQILLNLLGNANKFTSAGEIELAALERRDGPRVWLLLRVRDTGIGIPSDKHALIFEAFTQADNTTTRRFGGTGLGLTISRRLCEMMGGTLELESEVGVGSTFTARLPLDPAG